MDEAECLRILADQIRARAQAKNVAIETLADLAGVSRSMMWKVLGREHVPNLAWILKVANALGCKPSDLVP